MGDKRCRIKPLFPHITYSPTRLGVRANKFSKNSGAISKF